MARRLEHAQLDLSGTADAKHPRREVRQVLEEASMNLLQVGFVEAAFNRLMLELGSPQRREQALRCGGSCPRRCVRHLPRVP